MSTTLPFAVFDEFGKPADDRVQDAIESARQQGMSQAKAEMATAETSPCGHPASLMLTSAETGAPLYCELCDDKSGRLDAEQREQELQAELAAAKAEMAKAEQAVPVAWAIARTIDDDDGRAIGMDEPEMSWGAECPDPTEDWSPLFASPPVTERRPLTVPPEIMAIAERLHTQDNRITDNPLFAVQQKRCIAGLDEDYTDSFEWVTDDCEEIHDAAEIADLEAAHAEGEDTPGARRIGVKYIWEFVTGCFTEQGCKSYIASNGHNLKEPRIYAYGSYRNAEFIALRNWLMSITAGTTEQAKEQE